MKIGPINPSNQSWGASDPDPAKQALINAELAALTTELAPFLPKPGQPVPPGPAPGEYNDLVQKSQKLQKDLHDYYMASGDEPYYRMTKPTVDGLVFDVNDLQPSP